VLKSSKASSAIVSVTVAQSACITDAKGYHFEIAIPLSYLGIKKWVRDAAYSLEVAIDQGESGGRTKQLRWNSPNREGFHTNPSLWGKMIFE